MTLGRHPVIYATDDRRTAKRLRLLYNRSFNAMQPVSSTLKKIFADTLRRGSAADAPLLAWPLACGSKVAEKTSAIGYADGVLTVEVPDATWRLQLQGLQPAISCGPEADQRAAGERDQVCNGEPGLNGDRARKQINGY